MKLIIAIGSIITIFYLNSINNSLRNINKTLQPKLQSQIAPKFPSPLFSIDSTGAHTITNDTLFK
jgi:hypothetical protein